jgi:hypothetical protein
VVAGAERLHGFEEIVADELNVKSVRLLDADHPDARRTASRSGSRSTPAPPARARQGRADRDPRRQGG